MTTTRRRTEWIRFLLEGGSLSSGEGSVTRVTLRTYDQDDGGKTLTRIVGDMWLTPSSTVGFSGGSFGLAVVDQDAAAAAATPEPRSDDFPWLWLGQFNLNTVSGGELRPLHIPIDVRAQRKVTSNGELMYLFESGGMAGALNIEMQGRMLFKLP